MGPLETWQWIALGGGGLALLVLLRGRSAAAAGAAGPALNPAAAGLGLPALAGGGTIAGEPQVGGLIQQLGGLLSQVGPGGSISTTLPDGSQVSITEGQPTVTPPSGGGGGTPPPGGGGLPGAPALPGWAANIPGAHYIRTILGNGFGWLLVDASGNVIPDPGGRTGSGTGTAGPSTGGSATPPLPLPGPNTPPPIANPFTFVLPSVYRQTSNFFNQWGFSGNSLGGGRPAMQGITAGTVLGDLGGLVFPVNYQPSHDTRTVGSFSTGAGFSGASTVLTRTYDIAAQYGQLNNQAYVQQILKTQLSRLKQDAINNHWNLNALGWDLSNVPAYYATSYAPGSVDVRW